MAGGIKQRFVQGIHAGLSSGAVNLEAAHALHPFSPLCVHPVLAECRHMWGTP